MTDCMNQIYTTHITIDCDQITDWESFHAVFAKAFGFPDFYGENMNAWVDCMSSLDTPEDGMTGVYCNRGETITLYLKHIAPLKRRCPEAHQALLDSTAFVNYRQTSRNEPALIALSYYDNDRAANQYL